MENTFLSIANFVTLATAVKCCLTPWGPIKSCWLHRCCARVPAAEAAPLDQDETIITINLITSHHHTGRRHNKIIQLLFRLQTLSCNAPAWTCGTEVLLLCLRVCLWFMFLICGSLCLVRPIVRFVLLLSWFCCFLGRVLSHGLFRAFWLWLWVFFLVIVYLYFMSCSLVFSMLSLHFCCVWSFPFRGCSRLRPFKGQQRLSGFKRASEWPPQVFISAYPVIKVQHHNVLRQEEMQKWCNVFCSCRSNRSSPCLGLDSGNALWPLDSNLTCSSWEL